MKIEVIIKVNDIFNIDTLNITEKLSFHFLSINEYDKKIKEAFNQNLASMVNGIDGDDDILIVKEELKKWFKNKEQDDAKKCGYIAEFICHFYLRHLKYRQFFLFQNLEEANSMKKGFDGLYRLGNELWLYESKSTLPRSKEQNHNSNISEAFNDLKKKIEGNKLDSGGEPINPWHNALTHASQVQIRPDKTLCNHLTKLKKNFIGKKYEKINNYSVIPSSTIFLEDKWHIINSDDLREKLHKLCKRYKYKSMSVICINKKSINNFLEYINER